MSHIRRSTAGRSDDVMDDDSDDKDSKRKSRNLSEKKRRDQFNLLVNELSVMVSSGGRKMDKSTVLKATISFLKNHNEVAVRSRVHEIQEEWKPTFLTNEEFTHLVLEAVDGFIMVFATSGQIFYASESITSLLGHLPSDLLGMTLYELVNDDEQGELYNTLMGPAEEENKLSFSCYLRRGGSDARQSSSFYELVHFEGYLRSDTDMVQTDSSRHSGYSGEADSRLVFVGTGRLQTPQLIREMPLIDSSNTEFISRHSLEWKFLFIDHRAPPIIGYFPFELLGTSGYDYYHTDDLERVVGCHEALMQKGEGTSCYYRFLTKGQQWIWLQTRFYITYHQWNSKPEFVVCTHRVVSYVNVMKQNIKNEENIELLIESSPNNKNSSKSWKSRTSRSRVCHGPSSDCTSMSADSPTSRHSVMSEYSVKTRTSGGVSVNVPTQSTQTIVAPTFMEPPQYVAAIPVQPVITNFASPAVLSPLPVNILYRPDQVIDNIGFSQIHNQMQADLQRKHAELQAVIGQQQAELRRVSEQLLMARLGLLPSTQAQCNVSSSNYNTSTVSSTTTMAGIPAALAGPSVVVPTVSVPITIPITQNLVFTSPDE
ncbi:PREDICTED: circadian locomoter output cycles protein kaput-like isoform X3 [Nicrophorus vespilloides]|uniref:Circadian locomoter output cycles protein kaput-like isoform X3 n=1 Tax=Nicrophorus vespilloides TaxID=110193 RepID=A0ABM1MZ23_NICVS|nr:PREDICTED: circadian locomoter output cycles protein kaput-like isoform X3 [Nicrophorus vespilloides]